MVLSDSDIRKELASENGLTIEPLTDDQIQPASVDLRLGNDFRRLTQAGHMVIDTRDSTSQPMQHFTDDRVVVRPGDCILATTQERIEMPPHLAGFAEGRSSIGRLFVEVHQTAGIVDPGFEGELTLEIKGNNPHPVVLHEGQRVCQLVVDSLSSMADNPYGEELGSKYQEQVGATPSRLHEDPD